MIETEQGKFGEEDKVILLHGIKVTLLELANTLICLRDNENSRQGNGWLNQHGDHLFKTMLRKIEQGISFEELKPFLTPGFRIKDFEKSGFNYKDWDMVFCDRCGKQAYCPDCMKYIWRNRNEN